MKYKKRKKRAASVKVRLQLCTRDVTARHLTSVDADKRTLGDIVQTANAPAFILGLEKLETHLQAVLNEAVCAHLSTAFAAFVTFVDAKNKEEKIKLSLTIQYIYKYY